MKTIYLECNMGASGDMLMASLLELYGDQETFLRTMNGLGLPGVEVRSEPSQKCGITGTHIRVLIGGAEERSGNYEPVSPVIIPLLPRDYKRVTSRAAGFRLQSP